MNTARRVAKNSALLIVSELVSKILQLIVIIYIARVLGAADFGKFNFGFAFSTIAVILADLGINYMLIREIARDREKSASYFFNGAVAKLFLSVFTLLLSVIALKLMGYKGDALTVTYLMLGFMVLKSFTELFYSVFRAYERMEFDAGLKTLRMMLIAGLVWYALASGKGIVQVALMFLVSEAIVFLISMVICLPKFIKRFERINFGFARELATSAIPFGLSIAFGSIYFYIDSVMLSLMKGDVELGVYSAAYNLAIAILFIPSMYTSAIFPMISRYYKDSLNKFRYVYKKSFKYLYITGLPISIFTFFRSESIIALFYGQEYGGAATALRIISFFIFIKFINFLLGNTLAAADRQYSRMAVQGLTALVNVGLNFALIPGLGLIGAAIATLATEIFLFIVYFSQTSRVVGRVKLIPVIAKPLLAGIAMAVALAYSDFNLIAEALLALAVYGAVLLLIRTFSEDDIALFRQVMRNE